MTLHFKDIEAGTRIITETQKTIFVIKKANINMFYFTNEIEALEALKPYQELWEYERECNNLLKPIRKIK